MAWTQKHSTALPVSLRTLAAQYLTAKNPTTLSATTASTAIDPFARFAKYYDDPVSFARDVFGIELWSRQIEICIAAVEYDRVAVKSGHKIGKTAVISVLAYWWYCTRPEARVFITNSSGRQVKDVNWREIRRFWDFAIRKGNRLPGECALAPATGVRCGDRQIVGFTTDKPERMAGLSGQSMMFIGDEASGIPVEIFEAIEGNRAGGRVKLFLISNPTQTSGFFFDAFNDKSEGWSPPYGALITVSSEETPNYVEGRQVIPGLASRSYIEEKRRECGPDYTASVFYQVRILGQFPAQGSQSVVPLALVEAGRSEDRQKQVLEDGDSNERLNLGVDVAGFGDDETVIIARRGRRVYSPVHFSKIDEVDVAGHVLAYARKHRKDDKERPLVKIDANGVGAGVAAILAREPEVEVVPVIASERADDESKYANKRAQLWFGIKEFLEKGGALPPDAKLERELVAPMFKFDNKLRILVEKKDEIRKRLQRSPDRADALAMAIYIGSVRGPRKIVAAMGRGTSMEDTTAGW